MREGAAAPSLRPAVRGGNSTKRPKAFPNGRCCRAPGTAAAGLRDPRLHFHRALKAKAASTHRSISTLVDDAVRESLREDQEDPGK